MPTSPFAAGNLDYIARLNELANASFSVAAQQSANFAAAKGWIYPLATNALSVTLPSGPVAGDRIYFLGVTSSIKSVTLLRNGNKIDSAAADKTVTVSQYVDFVITYIDATVGWRVGALAAVDTQVNTNTSAIATNTTAIATKAAKSAVPYRNKLINGGFDIAQRGTSQTLTGALVYGSVDRWGFTQIGGAGGATAAQQADNTVAGFTSRVRVGRNAGATATGNLVMGQILQTADAVRMQGKQVTLSFWAQAGAQFSAAASGLVVQLFTGTGTDQTLSTQIFSGLTGSVSAVNVNQAITTSPVRYSFTVTLNANIKQIALNLSYTPVGTAGADDGFYIYGAQLEVGDTVTDFDDRPEELEYALCRYFYRRFTSNAGNHAWIGCGECASTTAGFVPFALAANMRATPTLNFSAIGDMFVYYLGSNNILNGLTIAPFRECPLLNFTTTGGLTAGNLAILFVAAGTGKWLEVSAEL